MSIGLKKRMNCSYRKSNQTLTLLRILFLLITACSGFEYSCLAQKQNNQWRFGGGGINFNTNPPSQVQGAALSTPEGSASVADKNTGELLFYTDGVTVWNAQNQIMLNGTGLQGGSVLLSSTTAAVIIPKPGSSNLYYIVTVDEGSSGSGTGGIRYTVVNMSLEGGLGAVDLGQKNVFLFQTNTEKLEVVPAANGTDYWIVTHESSNFVSFRVSSSGIQTTPVQSVVSGDLNNSSGHLKVNSQFNMLATGNLFQFKIRLFNFNNATGVVSDRISIPINSTLLTNSPLIYGVEFSPNGRFIYCSNINSLYQFDVSLSTEAAMAASAYLVDNGGQPASVQIGPDRKIYINNGSLRVINCPDKPGNSCGYANTSFGAGGYGLPKWVYYPNDTPVLISNSIAYSDSCFGNSTQFSIRNTTGVSAVSWVFGDPNSGASNSDTGLTASHTFSQTGSFNVRAIVTNICGLDTLRLNVLQILNCNPTPPTITGIKISGDTCTSLTLAVQATGEASASPYLKWNFGDPASGSSDTITGTSPTHTFSGPGLYNICVTFQEPGFPPKTICRSISIKQCCQGVILSSDSCLANAIPFSVNSAFPVSNIEWEFGDAPSGGNNVATGLNPSHTFSSVGTYAIKATITSSCGVFTRTLTKTIVPCSKPCVGKILFIDSCLANGTGFRLKSDFAINAIAWNFGDIASGNTNISAEVNPLHIFSKPGKYLISATVNAACGLFLTTDSVAIVTCPPPCGATISFSDSCIENGTGFSINSFYSLVSASWNFGDSLFGSSSNTSSLAAPTHDFSKAGNYMVTAQVELSCGTKQSTKPISIVICTCKAFVPNLLIANGNGVNDIFEISNLCPTKSFRLRIYNRWGKEVFASENPNEKWDSNTVSSGTYFFALDLLYESAPPESLKGWVNVVN